MLEIPSSLRGAFCHQRFAKNAAEDQRLASHLLKYQSCQWRMPNSHCPCQKCQEYGEALSDWNRERQNASEPLRECRAFY